MPQMTLDVKDRVIPSNQYKILEALYPDDAKTMPGLAGLSKKAMSCATSSDSTGIN